MIKKLFKKIMEGFKFCKSLNFDNLKQKIKNRDSKKGTAKSAWQDLLLNKLFTIDSRIACR